MTSVAGHRLSTLAWLTLVTSISVTVPARGDGGVLFQDVALFDNGIDYLRTPSTRNAPFDAIKQNPPYGTQERIATPINPWGAPGVALFDFDGDGDLDIYVTNGPGTPNSLFSNQLAQTGLILFEDVAGAAGVGAEDQDSGGVCFGDIDNDGDEDLYVLSTGSPNRLFENRGDGTFADVTAASGTGSPLASTSCTMADVDGDGLLDIVVANSGVWDDSRALLTELFALNQHNQLFHNLGGNAFEDVSQAAGLHDLAGLPPASAGAAGFTWAVAAADYDLDGDVDVLFADDQGGFPEAGSGGTNRGLLHLFENDGSGHFTDVGPAVGVGVPGGWRGFSLGDYDCDGTLDVFATNFGDHAPGELQTPGKKPSRWFLGQGDGTFADSGVGGLVTTPFGWGTSTFDYDNDGDLDIIYHGGMDLGTFIESGNGGVVLQNPGCSAKFEWDAGAFDGPPRHNRRVVHGVASGDVDGNGFVDVVSVSSMNVPANIPLELLPPLGSPFDATAFVVPTFEPTSGGGLAWNGNVYEGGTLAVDVNTGGNGNGSASFRTLGTAGLLPGGRVNRDGIGAVVFFTPENGPTVLRPVVGGSSYGSQDALEVSVGMGAASRGTVEILWPGGVRNRLVDVQPGERILFPEIPCSIDDRVSDPGYADCVREALDGLVALGIFDEGESQRFRDSAVGQPPPPPPTGCQPGQNTLCLHDGRFSVEVDWRDGVRTGVGRLGPEPSDVSGSFYFFSSDNWEVLVKVLDGCSFNDHYWVFTAAATDVEYRLVVTDTQTHVSKTYGNELGAPARAITDTQAFATCP